MGDNKTTRWRGSVMILVLAAVGLVLGLRSCNRPHKLKVTITADHTRVLPSSHLTLSAVLEPKPSSLKGYTFAWTASSGEIHGDKASAEWSSPGASGPSEIRLTVTAPDGGSASAELEVRVQAQAPVPEGLPSAGDEVPNEPGYEITDVQVDRDHLCFDDDVRVRVKATDPDGRSDWLVPIVRLPGSEAQRGFDVVAQAGSAYIDGHTSEFDDPEHLIVDLADARTQRIVARKVIPFKTENCKSPQGGLRVVCDFDAESELPGERLICSAVSTRPDFTPVRYEWAGGLEGTDPLIVQPDQTARVSKVTIGPIVQRQATTTVLVQAKAFDATGASLQGRTTFYVPNAFWQAAKMSASNYLIITYRSGAIPANGGWEETVRVFNPNDDAVDLASVEEREWDCPTGATPYTAFNPVPKWGEESHQAESEVPSRVTKKAPAEVLGFASMNAGEAKVVEIRRGTNDKVCGIDFTVHGTMHGSGRAVEGTFAFKMHNRMVNATPDMNKVLLQAEEILSKRRGVPVHAVNVNELKMLEQEGLITLPGPTELPTDLPPGAAVYPGNLEQVKKYQAEHPRVIPQPAIHIKRTAVHSGRRLCINEAGGIRHKRL